MTSEEMSAYNIICINQTEMIFFNNLSKIIIMIKIVYSAQDYMLINLYIYNSDNFTELIPFSLKKLVIMREKS
jgi:hypothetical protein